MNLMRVLLVPSFLVVPLVLCCSKQHSAGDGHDHGKATTPAEHAHGAAGAIPGSYADWCGEHAVPESRCTRCDPSLAAAFKATHDWCAEHGLPESQCLACNPDLKIERPPKPAGGE